MKKAVITLMMLTAYCLLLPLLHLHKVASMLISKKWIVTCSNFLQSKKKALPLS